MASLVMPAFAPDAQRPQRDPNNNASHHNHSQPAPQLNSSRLDGSATRPLSSSRSTSTPSGARHPTPQDSRPTSSSQAQTPPQPPSPRLDPSQQLQPTPQHDHNDGRDHHVIDSPTTPGHVAQSLDGSTNASPATIKIRDLKQIQSFVEDETNSIGQSRLERSESQQEGISAEQPRYEIAEMPISDVIEMVAGILTKITTTNDRQHEHLHRQYPASDGAPGLSQQTSSVLAFHGKTVPSITILSYLARIHKYCPTTYEVFISLLVYFDRMTVTVNSGRLEGIRRASELSLDTMLYRSDSGVHNAQSRRVSSEQNNAMTSPTRGQTIVDRQLQDRSARRDLSSSVPSDPDLDLSHFFVVDSFNIHRLIISAVTCASKFFSDIFYTNSRYAKVGGLPLIELNHLELQFLHLNDFRLQVPAEELQAYGTMLVEFYAREYGAQRQSEALAQMDITV